MMIEHRLQPGLIRIQGTGYYTDLVEMIAVHLDQSEDFTADRRQLLFDPYHVGNGKFDQLRCSSSLPFPTPILMGVSQGEQMTFKKSARKDKGRAIL